MRRGIAPYYNLGILAKSNIILYIQIRDERYMPVKCSFCDILKTDN
jgi:hypothetical protein